MPLIFILICKAYQEYVFMPVFFLTEHWFIFKFFIDLFINFNQMPIHINEYLQSGLCCVGNLNENKFVFRYGNCLEIAVSGFYNEINAKTTMLNSLLSSLFYRSLKYFSLKYKACFRSSGSGYASSLPLTRVR